MKRERVQTKKRTEQGTGSNRIIKQDTRQKKINKAKTRQKQTIITRSCTRAAFGRHKTKYKTRTKTRQVEKGKNADKEKTR